MKTITSIFMTLAFCLAVMQATQAQSVTQNKQPSYTQAGVTAKLIDTNDSFGMRSTAPAGLTGNLQVQTAIQGERPPFAPDRVLVKLTNTTALRSMASGPGVAQLQPDLGIAYSGIRLLNPSKGNVSTGSFSTMNVNDKQNNVYVLVLEESGEDAVRKALEILNANPAVEFAEPVFYYQLYKTPNDPGFSEQYAFNKINARQAWDITTGSKNVVIGIVDTGIDGTHPDLKDNLWKNPDPNRDGYVNDLHGYNFEHKVGGIPTDVGYHGTHVAGIVGAKGNNGTGVAGINWDVSLAWLGVSTDGYYVSTDAAIEALNYANNHNIQITNNSWGGGDYSKGLEEAIRYYNGLFVAAAGNDGRNNDGYPHYPSGYNLPNVISVASTDQDDRLSSFSNFGANSVHIAAPGSDILSALTTGYPEGLYCTLSGTSMATPYVAGVAALIKSINPDLSPAQIREILIATARPVSSLNGFGILDAHAALIAVSNNHLSTRIDLSQNNPSPAGLGWTFDNNVYTVGSTRVSITGSNAGSERRVEVTAGATAYITLDNASITGLSAGWSPLLLGSRANATLTLLGNNTLTAGSSRAGIQVPQGASLTIGGIGSLTATGGSDGAGIGGGISGAGGNITVSGGVVTATGGLNAQGIGRGSGSAAAGTFAMSGHAVVIANSVGDTNESRRTGGILFNGNTGTFYGENVAISTDITTPANLAVPVNRLLTVPEGATLTIPAGITLTNNSMIINYGVITINVSGTLMNNGDIVNFGTINGMVTGNSPIPDFPLGSNSIDLSVNNPLPRGAGWTFSGNVYTVLDGADVTVTGTSANQRRIAVAVNAAANITLNNVNILLGSGDDDKSPLLLHSGANATLTLEGTNTLTAGSSRAGIQVPQGTTLTITGTGSLTARGGWGSAGIGGSTNGDCGNITINGGVVAATGSIGSIVGKGGAGIGGGSGGSGGTVTINGGIVTATGSGGAGIGSGGGDTAGTFTMNGDAIVFASSVGDMDESRKTGGILVVGNATHWYGGNNFSLSQNMTVSYNYVLTVDKGKILTIPSGITLTNNRIIINYGEITIHGTLINNGYSSQIINFGTINGTVNGKSPITDITLSSSIDLSINEPSAVGYGWIFANYVYTILNGADVSVTGTSAYQRRIEVAANATANITLNNVSVTGLGSYQSPLLLNAGAAVNLTIEGENILEAGTSRAGIQTTNATIVIDGAGKLVAKGGGQYSYGGGAGIGGGGYNSGGNITVNGGIVAATGILGGAGIGGGGGLWPSSDGGAGGNITINGGVVTAIATGINEDVGIGGGVPYGTAGTLAMNGNAIVFTNSVGDTDESRRTGGILFIGNKATGTFYGTNVTITDDAEIPAGYTLTVPADATLTIPADRTLVNNGTVYGCGTINIHGMWIGNPVRSCMTTETLPVAIVNGKTVTLKWAPVAGATKYILQCKQNSASKWASKVVAGTTVSLSLTAGNTYNWQVAATTNSIYSKGPDFTLVPVPPTGLKAKVSDTAVTLSWSTKAGATGYAVQYKAYYSSAWTTVWTTAGSISLPNLTTPNLSYNWQVASVNAGGTSAYAKGSNFVTTSASPTNLQASVNGRTASLSWTAVAGATKYIVQYKRSTSSGWTSKTVTGVTASLTTLVQGSTYNWQVAAVNTGGTSAYTPGDDFIIVPAAPSGLKATVSGTTAILSWSAKDGATGYSIQYKLSNSSVWTTVTAAANRIDVPSLAAGTYNWQAAAINAAGSSAYAKGSNFTIKSSKAPADDTDDTFEATVTGLEALNIQPADLQLYPNPVHSVLYIRGLDALNANVERSAADKATTQAYIYNLSGSVVKTVILPTIHSAEIDVSNLSAGNYILRIADKSVKFVKK